MTFTDFCTLIAYLSTELTEAIKLRRGSAHPTGAECADVATVAAKARALCHEFITMMLCHADHAIRTCFAHLGARETRIDASLILLR
jgi:hypothetical protein